MTGSIKQMRIVTLGPNVMVQEYEHEGFRYLAAMAPRGDHPNAVEGRRVLMEIGESGGWTLLDAAVPAEHWDPPGPVVCYLFRRPKPQEISPANDTAGSEDGHV